MSASRDVWAMAAFVAMLSVAPVTCRAEASEATNLMLLKPDDAAVNAAERKASETLPVFWTKFDAKEPGVSHYLVKVALRAKGGGREILWAVPLRHTAAAVEVRLANQPVYLARLGLGSVIDVDPSEIVDWSYQKDGKLYGNFVTRVTMDRAAPDERALMQAALAPEPLESEVR